jgi:ABC-type transporter Mla subunit MlaD
MMDIVTDNSAVIATLNKRIENLERYNSGLANESCEQQARIAELEAIIRGRDELINNAESSRIAELEIQLKQTLDNAMCQASDLRDRIAGLEQEQNILCLEHRANTLCFALENITNPEIIYYSRKHVLNEIQALKEQDNG